MTPTTAPSCYSPTASEADTVRRMILEIGEPAAIRALGLPRATITRVAAGLPCRRGTLVVLRLGLERLQAEADAAAAARATKAA